MKKGKKIPPVIHPRNKYAKLQPNPTIFEVSRVPPKYLGHTDRQTFSDSQLKFFYYRGNKLTSFSWRALISVFAFTGSLAIFASFNASISSCNFVICYNRNNLITIHSFER